MLSFAAARRYMVDGQLRINDVTNPRVIGAMQTVPRERFVPRDKVELAYLDLDLPVLDGAAGPARYLLKPLVLAKLIDLADVAPTDRVLDVGCATGYSAAVLSALAAKVVAVDEDEGLAHAAESNCANFGCSNVTVHRGPLANGAPGLGPFNVILLNGAVEFIPDALSAQLAEGGRLVCVLRQNAVGKGMLYLRSAGTLSSRAVFDAAAPLLPGFVTPPAFAF